MKPKYIYNTSDIGYMDEEWLDHPEVIEDNKFQENEIIKNEEELKEV